MPRLSRSEQIVQRFEAALTDRPQGRVAAVRDDGLFCDVPEAVPLQGQRPIEGARAGLDLVGSPHRVTVLEQFRQLAADGSSEVPVTLTDGSRARYALFDTREAFGVIMLLVSGLEEDAGPQPVRPERNQAARPRSGRVKRTELAELLEADDAVLGMLGYSREEFAGLDTRDSIHPDDYQTLIGQWFDLLGAESGSTRRVRVRYRCGDCSWLWVELTVTQRLDDPEQPHMLCELVDISEEMSAIEEVWRSRELLHRLTESLPVGVVQIDPERRIVHGNDRLREILEAAPADTLEAQFANLIPADHALLLDTVQAALTRGADGDIECRFQRRDSSGGYAQIVCRCLRGRAEEVTGAILCVSDVSDSTRLRKELEQRASLDMLTGCLNRATALAELDGMLAAGGPGTAVAFIDLDRFKPVNDELGHAAGDQLLRQVAEALRRSVRGRDLVGRLGGDEFVVLCPEVGDAVTARRIGERLSEALRFGTTLSGTEVVVQASIGVAWTATRATPEELVNRADKAMYESKRGRRQRPIYLAWP